MARDTVKSRCISSLSRLLEVLSHYVPLCPTRRFTVCRLRRRSGAPRFPSREALRKTTSIHTSYRLVWNLVAEGSRRFSCELGPPRLRGTPPGWPGNSSRAFPGAIGASLAVDQEALLRCQVLRVCKQKTDFVIFETGPTGLTSDRGYECCSCCRSSSVSHPGPHPNG